MTIVFLNFWPKNAEIRQFWSQIWVFLFFREILQLEKFEGADFEYGKSFFKLLIQKYSNKAFLIPNLSVFVFSQNFAIRQV